jgi:ubiquinone/menaquinone biosynthesis C-methylase UbiE
MSASVRDLFNAKAPFWSSKYRGRAVLGWRVEAFVASIQETVAPPDRVLDFGCGTGEITHALKVRGYRVSACDIAEEMIARCRSAFGDEIEWVTLDATASTLPFDAGSFAGMVASSVLEYVPDVDAVVGEWARVLRPGGSLAVTVPDVTHPVRRVESLMAWVARGPIRRAARHPRGRLGAYVAYLRLSKNRHSVDGWARKASLHGFVLESTRRKGALVLLSFSLRGPT